MVAKKITNRKINKFLCITVILLLGACFIVSPACATLDVTIDPVRLVVEEKFDKSVSVDLIKNDATLSPKEKNKRQAELFGWSNDLEKIINKHDPVAKAKTKDVKEIIYTKEELTQLDNYYTTYILNYKGSSNYISDVS